MKVDNRNTASWGDHSQLGDDAGTHAAEPNSQSAPAGTLPIGGGKSQKESEARTLATNAVVANDLTEAADELIAALAAVAVDVQSNKDATNDMVKVSAKLDTLLKLYSADTPSPQMQGKINRLTYSLLNAKPGDTLESTGKKAHVDLSGITQHSPASLYAKYGKLASTGVRAMIFDWARFHNSNVVKGTWLGKLQRPEWAALDQLGRNVRPGILVGTRFNAGASNITKGISGILGGLAKWSQGQNGLPDFLSGMATFLQGVNEVTLGAATDVGNHLARSHAKPKQSKPIAETTPDASRPGTSREVTNFGSDDPLVSEVDRRANTEPEAIAAQVSEQQQQLRDQAMAAVEGSSLDVRPLTLQDSVHEIAPEYFALREIGENARKNALEIAKETHDNIKQIDEHATETLSKLKDMGFDNVEAARLSGRPEVTALTNELDHYAELKRSAYDVFNKAMDSSEQAVKEASESFAELRSMHGLPPAEARSRLLAWADTYGKRFAQTQDTFLKQTDSWPEWMKISKPLRMQLIPTGVNAALGAVPFGFALNDYLKKQKDGTLTEQDRLNFAGACINLIAGPIGFIPVVGPLVSIVLSVIGAICNGYADQIDGWNAQENEYNLKEQLREQFNKAHPNQQIAEPFDGD